MSKDKFTDYSVTASSNTDVGGININTNCDFGNVDDALRELMSHLAETNAGTYPVADTWTFADPADLTKKFRFDGGSITTGTSRVITVPDRTGTMVLEAGAQTFISKSFADVSDNTKILAFTLSTIATATTRTVIWPNANGTVMLNETFTGLYPTAVSLEGLSLVAGDILYATAADTLSRLPKGTAGQDLRMNSGATAPEWVTPILTKSFTSAEQTITLGGSVALAHGMGVQPKVVQTVLVCKTAELGYSIGHILPYPLFSDSGGSTSGMAFVIDATNMNYRYGSGSIVIPDLSTGNRSVITPANWRVVVYAFA